MKIKSMYYEILMYVMAILFSFVLTRYVFAFNQVPTSSMESSIMAGDAFLSDRILYEYHSIGPLHFQFKELKRGDIAVFQPTFTEDKLYVKRIIGIPGDHIEFKQGDGIYINGEKLVEDYVNESWEDTISDMLFTVYDVPEGNYFVMGDNRLNSYDSRYWCEAFLEEDYQGVMKASFVPRENIVSKYLFKVNIPFHKK